MTQAKTRSLLNKSAAQPHRNHNRKDSVTSRENNQLFANIIPEENMTIQSQSFLNQTLNTIKQRMSHNRPVTTGKTNGNEGKNSRNATTTAHGGRLTADSTKYTIQTGMNNSSIHYPKNTIGASQKNGVDQSIDSYDQNLRQTYLTADHSNMHYRKTNNKSEYDEQNNATFIRNRSSSNSNDVQNSQSDFFNQKRSTSRMSFKKSRADHYGGLFGQLERQFDSLKYNVNENIIHIKHLIVQAYDVANVPSLLLEDRKETLVRIWTQLIDYIKKSTDLNTFDMLFYAQKVLGDFYLDFKDLTEAIRVYKSIKILCEDFQKYKEKMAIYEQIGYTYRLMKEYDNAVKQFKKMLQLAWQEGDTQMETSAYDNLSLDYFYLGEIAKSNYYHDRIMRGKTENNRSIVKKVSCNLLVSRREQRHNIEQRKIGEKQKSELQRLPSPSAISKGTQFSKAINLLPNYTEAQAIGIEEDDEEEIENNNNQNEQQRQTKSVQGSRAKSHGARFTQKELMHLNKPPNYEYLKPPKKPSQQFKIRSLNKSTAQKESGGIYRQSEPVDYHPFDDERFRVIVEFAIQRKENSHTTDDKRNIQHMSVHRTAPLNQIVPTKLMESLKKSIEQYTIRMLQFALQEQATNYIFDKYSQIK